MTRNKIKVQLVDDSATVRNVLTELLSRDAGIEITGSAANPIFAQRYMKKCWPDVVVLDLEIS